MDGDTTGYVRRVSAPRQSPRLRYLRLAAERALVIDSSVASFQFLAAGIRLQTIAALMRRSRTSLYRLWDTQGDFHTDLALYLVVHNDYQAPSAGLPWRRSLAQPGPPAETGDMPDLVDATWVALKLVQDQILDDPWIAVRAATIGCGNAGELAPIRAAVEQQRIQDLTVTLDDLLAAGGLVTASPTRTRDLALGFWCLADGFATLARSLPRLQDDVVNVDDGNGPRPWGLFAFMARCLLGATTAPRVAPPAARPAAGAGGPEVAPIDRSWTPLQLEALQVGARLFTDRLEAPVDAETSEFLTGLSQINIANLAREAGVTRRSVYDLWPTSEDLRLDLLGGLLHAETSDLSRKLDRLTRSRTPVTPERALAALVREPNPQQLSPGEAACTFLLDLHRPTAKKILEVGSEAMLETVTEATDRAWPPSPTNDHGCGPNVTAIATIAMSTGANRLLRTAPAASDRVTLVDRALAPTLRAVLDHQGR